MNNQVNYTIVGIFVLLLGVTLGGIGLWLGSDISVKKYERYHIYMDESVSGLIENSYVKFQGVTVGKVVAIDLVADPPGRVKILIEVEENTPIRVDTTAQLTPQGLTSISYIELSSGASDAPPLERSSGDEYPEIDSKPSLIVRIDEVLNQAMDMVGKISSQFDTVIEDGTQERLTDSVERFTSMMEDLSKQDSAARESIDHTRIILANLKKSSEDWPGLMDRVDDITAEVETVSKQIREMTEKTDHLLASGQTGVDRFVRYTMPEIDLMLAEMRELARTGQELGRQLSEKPNALLWGSIPESGPGEQ